MRRLRYFLGGGAAFVRAAERFQHGEPGSAEAKKSASKITHELRDLFDIGDLAKNADLSKFIL